MFASGSILAGLGRWLTKVGCDRCVTEQEQYTPPEAESLFTLVPEPTPDPLVAPEQLSTIPSGDYDCSDFGFQAEAQGYLLPSDH